MSSVIITLLLLLTASNAMSQVPSVVVDTTIASQSGAFHVKADLHKVVILNEASLGCSDTVYYEFDSLSFLSKKILRMNKLESNVINSNSYVFFAASFYNTNLLFCFNKKTCKFVRQEKGSYPFVSTYLDQFVVSNDGEFFVNNVSKYASENVKMKIKGDKFVALYKRRSKTL